MSKRYRAWLLLMILMALLNTSEIISTCSRIVCVSILKRWLGVLRRTGFSEWSKEEFSDYPSREILVELWQMSKAEREEHTLSGLYLWANKYLVGKYHVGRSLPKV